MTINALQLYKLVDIKAKFARDDTKHFLISAIQGSSLTAEEQKEVNSIIEGFNNKLDVEIEFPNKVVQLLKEGHSATNDIVTKITDIKYIITPLTVVDLVQIKNLDPSFIETIFNELPENLNKDNLSDLLKIEDPRVNHAIAHSYNFKYLINANNICAILQKGGELASVVNTLLLEKLNSTAYDRYSDKYHSVGYMKLMDFLSPNMIQLSPTLHLDAKVAEAIQFLAPNFSDGDGGLKIMRLITPVPSAISDPQCDQDAVGCLPDTTDTQ